MLEQNHKNADAVALLVGKLFGNKEMRILMLGLDAAGKTSESCFGLACSSRLLGGCCFVLVGLLLGSRCGRAWEEQHYHKSVRGDSIGRV